MSQYFKKENVRVLGCDVFIAQREIPFVDGGKSNVELAGLNLVAISNRGTKVWPNQTVGFELTDLFQCRFACADGGPVKQEQIISLLTELNRLGFEFVHFEKLLEVNSKKAFCEIQ